MTFVIQFNFQQQGLKGKIFVKVNSLSERSMQTDTRRSGNYTGKIYYTCDVFLIHKATIIVVILFHINLN